MHIRAFRPSDAFALTRLTGSTPAVSRPERSVWVAEEGDRLVGTASLIVSPGPDRPVFRVASLFVLPERQGRGIGRALIRTLEGAARQRGAESLLVPAGFPSSQGTDTDSGTYILMGKPL
ncbi:MAG: GNAT family N-acetyltransferase [Armatimonadetes bacterium]|nr:GNAT family N-acetyltransferase [Armatimonadota bacterium]